MGMFARSLDRMGFAIRVTVFPRGNWSCKSIEGLLGISRQGWFTASIGPKGDGVIKAVICFHWAMLPYALLMSWKKKAPLIYDEHDHYELNTLEGSGALWSRRLIQYLIRLVHRLCIPKADLVSCIHQKDGHLRQHLLALNPAVVELANFPDDQWQSANRTPATGPVRFVYAGGVFAEKGLAGALAAFTRLEEEYPGACRMEVFGSGDVQLMRAIAATQGAVVHGDVSSSELRAFLSKHRCVGLAVLVNSHRYRLIGTNLTKLYEYLAMGMPVIVSDSGEVGAFVRESGTGQVVSGAEDTDGIASAMRQLVIDEGLFVACKESALSLMAHPSMRWEHEWKRLMKTGVFTPQADQSLSGVT
jgi:glycosyltransferase involved in cell wall biosynthesis